MKFKPSLSLLSAILSGIFLFARCCPLWGASPIDQTVGPTEGASTTINNEPIDVTNGTFAIRVQGFGANGSSGDDGGDAGAAIGSIGEFVNESGGNLVITLTETFTDQVFGIFLKLQGGQGGNSTDDKAKDNAGDGGDAGSIGEVEASNSEAITFNPGGQYNGGLALWEAIINGGNGGNVTPSSTNGDGVPQFKDGGVGGSAGTTGDVTLENGSLTAGTTSFGPLVAQGVAKGIHGSTTAGNPGEGAEGIDAPASGLVSITNSGPISLFLNNTTGSLQAYGIRATTNGGNGAASHTSGDEGGRGGFGGDVTVTLNQGGDINVTATGNDVSGAGIQAKARGGNGGQSYDRTTGGEGGTGGGVTVSVTDATVNTTGTDLPGIQAFNRGGNGGVGGVQQDFSDGGDGGNAENASVTLNAATSGVSTGITTNGTDSVGLLLSSTGGTGGQGTDYDNPFLGVGGAGDGGDGGLAGDLTVTLDNSGAQVAIQTSGDQSAGIEVTSSGGAGSRGGDINGDDSTSSEGSEGGSGADGGMVTFTAEGSRGYEVSTSGSSAHGVVLLSEGGISGRGGDVNSATSNAGEKGGSGGAGNDVRFTHAANSVIQVTGDQSIGVGIQTVGKDGSRGGNIAEFLGNRAGDGGDGGDGGDINITTQAGSSILTEGDEGFGLVARSLSGAGGAGGTAGDDGVASQGGDAGNGGDTGEVSLNHSGRIGTEGDGAFGILLQALTGAGGDAGDSKSVFYGQGGSGGSAGSLGNMTIDLDSSSQTVTAGDGAHAVLVQSIAGGGGSAGKGSGAVGLGGDSSAGGNGGEINVNASGLVTTLGENAIGLLSQSIAGGGGNGGSAGGVITVGSNGASGGNGGESSIQVGNDPWTIVTAGQLAHGIVNQSIGGGGGNGGNATADGAEITVAVGGSGGAGGNGGAATVSGNRSLSVSTGGSNSAGIVNQSIAGGGGTGGSAYSHSVGVGFDAAVAVGGSGGSGGSGGTSKLDLSGTTVSTGELTGVSDSGVPVLPANPVDSYGVVAQSIGGGGGHGGPTRRSSDLGGSATAGALAIAVPVPETDTEFAVSGSFGVGGTGGIGGTGGQATVLLYSESTVTTQGQGSHGVIAQSIGGGGGLGGDSSASAATVAFGGAAENSVSVSGEFTMGGAGGGGGDGGPVTVNIAADEDGDPAGTAGIVTYGDFANAVVAQSIGGGGGNAGFGSGNTRNRGGTVSISAGVNMGATGGSGGVGKAVSITMSEEGSIDTYGSGAHGVVAQSIGGGGGTSQGGSLSFGAAASLSGGDGDDVGEEDEGGDDEDLDLEGNVSISMGRDGGSGSNGGTVEIQNDGTITTRGGDAGGIIAQSIGGGGGIGGGAGGDASADNPIDPSTGERRFPVGGSGENGGGGEDDDDSTSVSATFSMELGGGGGEAADGNTVTVGNSGAISTSGDFSTGILAQSIGGGGGKAGTAVAQDTDASPDLSINVASGGSGGNAGNGGEVTFTLQDGSVISTAGYGAFGIHGQSVGGGGGIGVDGSGAGAGSESNPGKISLGGDFSGNGGNGGSGGTVELDGSTVVTTTGDAAHGIVLQSIGGGGGVGGQGSSASFGVGSVTPSVDLSVGGGSGSSGDGGTVTLNGDTVQITTSGWASYGILAQSIGGGGGLAWQPADFPTSTATVGGNNSSGNGGAVSITLGSGSSIQTSGFAAHGIVAQSIGGGGGIGGYPTTNPTTHYLGLPSRSSNSSTTGGEVSVNVDGTITTTGNAAHGIFVQSIGGGGGFRGYSNSVDMGSTGGSGAGGKISVTQAGSVSVSGTNSVGILAQQDGGSVSNQPVSVIINGSVTGGTGDQGYGVWMITNTNGSSELTINSGGSISAASGTAIRTDHINGNSTAIITNGGTITGSTTANIASASAPPVFLRNTATGRIFSGSRLQANVRNEGRIFVGRGVPGARFGRTEITGDFTQTSGGALIFRTDFERGQSDSLAVRGNAVLDGEVEPQPVPGSRILPNRRLTLLTVDGSISGDLRLSSRIPGIFEYDLSRSGNSFGIAAVGIDLEGIASGLTANQKAVARNLESVWLNGSGSLDVFGTFDAIARGNPGAVRNFFDELTPGATLGFAVRGPAEGQYFSDTVLNGPIFEGDTTKLAENPSAWLRAHGRTTSQRFGDDGFSNFRLDSMMYQTGGQKEIGEDLYIGGSIAYRNDSLSSKNNVSSGDGDTALAAVTLKHEIGPWLLAGAVSGSLGWYDTTRRITFPGQEGVAEGSPRVQTGALALRAAYTKAYKRIYLRPLLTLTGVHTNASGYTESGAGGFDLKVDQADQTTLFATPAIEIGARSDFSNEWILRSFARVGLDLASSDSWDQEARFVGAPDAATDFTTSLPLDEVSGMVTAGIDLQFSETTSAHIRYEGKFSENVSTNGGSIGLKLTF